jgi:hypothetical protein
MAVNLILRRRRAQEVVPDLECVLSLTYSRCKRREGGQVYLSGLRDKRLNLPS